MKPSGPGARALLAESDAERLVAAADFLSVRSVLEPCDVGLAARLAEVFSWTRPCSWGTAVGMIGSDSPADRKWLEFGERYSLPHVVAAALDPVLWKLTRIGARTAAYQSQIARLDKSVTGVVGKVIAEAEEPTANVPR